LNAGKLLEQGKRRLRECADRFDTTGLEYQEASEILTDVLGREPDANDEVPATAARRFTTMLERRAVGEPLPYILGYTDFRTIRLNVKHGAFIPRSTTEFLADEAVRRLRRRPSPVAVDVATGIGPVALSIAKDLPQASVFGVDLEPAAVRQARANARSLGARNATFLCGSLFAPLPSRLRGAVDLITAHPPYVGRDEVRELPPEIRDFEPLTSLTDDSPNGLGLAHQIVQDGQEWMRPGGWLLIEIGSYLARMIRSDMMRSGYKDVRSRMGEWRYTRVIAGRK